MEEDEKPLAALAGGDDRRPVLERRPGLLGEIALGLGEDLAADAEIGRDRQAEERAFAGEGREGARRIPGERAAEVAPAAAQPHRHEVVVAGGEPRAGEAQEHAAALDEGRDLAERLAVERADVGEDQHRDLLVEKLRHRIGDGAAALAHLGIGRERARQVVVRRQERLRLVGRAAEDEPDAPALAALVEEGDGAGRALAEDLDAGDAVADLDRQLEAHLGVGGAGRERERRIGERQVLEVERPHGAAVAPVRLGAHEPRGEMRRGVLGAGEGERRRALGLEHRDGAVFGHPGEALDEGLAVNAGDAVIDPDHGCGRHRGEETLDCGQMRAAIGEMRLRLHGPQPLERRGGVQRLQLDRLVGGGDDRDDAALAPGGLDPLDRKRQALAPVMRGREVVVDDEEQRRAPVLPLHRVPHRTRRREDQQRRDREAQRQQPPRRARRRLAFRQEVEQDLQRREVDPPRPRRRHPEDQPDHRQRGERRQHDRRREGEGEAEHRQPARFVTTLALPPRAAVTRVTRRSAASVVGRSVRWMVRVQPRRRARSSIASRCSRMRSR